MPQNVCLAFYFRVIYVALHVKASAQAMEDGNWKIAMVLNDMALCRANPSIEKRLAAFQRVHLRYMCKFPSCYTPTWTPTSLTTTAVSSRGRGVRGDAWDIPTPHSGNCTRSRLLPEEPVRTTTTAMRQGFEN